MSDVPEPPEPTLPVESALAADQVAAHAAEGHGHHGPFHTHCENCGTKLEGPFCHRCGQHDFEFHRSFWHVFLEGLESFLHFDSKLFHTVATLVFRPGRLTAEFNAGKRASQMPPLRLYIFVSLVFFTLFFLQNHTPAGLAESGFNVDAPAATPEEAEIKQAWTEAGQALAGTQKGKRAVDLVREAAEKTKAAVQARPDQSLATDPAAPANKEQAAPAADAPDAGGKNTLHIRTLPVKETDSAFLHWLQAQGRRAADPEHQREMVEKFLHALPKLLLFCLPFYALYTWLLFRRSGLVYLQHLVLSLHVHTMILLWSMLKDGWVFLGGLASPGLASLATGICNVWLLLYPFLMFRHLFAGSWPKTIFKTGLLGALYSLTLMFATLVGGFIIFAML